MLKIIIVYYSELLEIYRFDHIVTTEENLDEEEFLTFQILDTMM
jgi:hypothetical protein